MTYGTFLTSLIINSSFKFKRCLKNNKDLMKLKEIKNPFSIIVVFFFLINVALLRLIVNNLSLQLLY